MKQFNNANYSLDFNIFRKETFTGLGMNFHSHTSFKYKLNNIRTLLHRAYALCTSWRNFHQELEFLTGFFKNNAYPEHVVFNIINKFLNLKCSNNNIKTVKAEAKKMVMYQKIPFINDSTSGFIRAEMKKIIDKFYPQIDFRPVFYNPFTIKGLTNHKEKLPDSLCSGVCYIYKCGACSATYIGSSIKCLQTRAFEHFGRSPRTGNLLVKPLQSKVREHIFNCESNFTLDNFKILSSHSDQTLLRIAESLEICFSKPNLNVDTSSFPLHLV